MHLTLQSAKNIVEVKVACHGKRKYWGYHYETWMDEKAPQTNRPLENIEEKNIPFFANLCDKRKR